ncbi:MAG TPA: choice-of-anchor tandem repeat GloVer-containing protein, partial [Flavobacteriales bacterium]|nr:choice-of-anchor tandem repeat GloVer-containing protein [Flavobacteriales bacterium]
MGTYPRGTMTVCNGKLYGSIGSGGAAGKGVLFEFNPVINHYSVKITLDETTGHFPWGGVYLYNNKLYGLTNKGGVRDGGSFFEWDPASNLYTKKVEFGSYNGRLPEGYTVYYDNKIWGIASEGGEDYKGVVYQYDPVTHTYSVIKQLTDATGYQNSNGSNGLVVHNSKIYGVVNLGGANGSGTLFEINPANNAFTKLYDFNWNSGQHPRGTLTSFDGKLYGGTSKGGSVNDMGTIFQYDPVANNLAVKVVMDAAKGKDPNGRMIVHNNKLYGTCFEGGANNLGTLFEYNPLANAYTKKVDFDGMNNGENIRGGLELMNGKIYGLADGGINNRGIIFEYIPGAT